MNNQPDKLSLGNLLNRVTSPTPAFDQQIRALALKIGGLAITVIAVNAGVPNLIPEAIVTTAKVLTIVCGTSAAHSQLQKEKEPENDPTSKT